MGGVWGFDYLICEEDFVGVLLCDNFLGFI